MAGHARIVLNDWRFLWAVFLAELFELREKTYQAFGFVQRNGHDGTKNYNRW
jgi:hypothetical protein